MIAYKTHFLLDPEDSHVVCGRPREDVSFTSYDPARKKEYRESRFCVTCRRAICRREAKEKSQKTSEKTLEWRLRWTDA